MTTLALDTATAATVIALHPPDAREPLEAVHLPATGERPGHLARALPLAAGLLQRSGLRFADVTRIGVGVGPGSFTGLRAGVAVARGLALATGAELVAVSTLEALAARVAGREGVVLAVVDARRGEVFCAGWLGGASILSPRAVTPERLGEIATSGGAGVRRPWLAVGDGAVRHRVALVAAGVDVPPPASPLHRVGASALARLTADGEPARPDEVLPAYLREPDARPRAAREAS